MSVHSDNINEVWQEALSLISKDSVITSQQLAFIRLSRPLGVLDDTVLLAVPNEFTKEFLETRSRTAITDALTQISGGAMRFAVTVDPASAQTSDGHHDSTGSSNSQKSTASPEAKDDSPNYSPPAFKRRIAVNDIGTDSHLPSSPLYDSSDDIQQRTSHRAPHATTPPFSDDSDQPTLAILTEEDPPAGPRPQPADGAEIPADSHVNPKYHFDAFVIGSSNRFAHAAAVAVAEAPAKAYNPLFIYGQSGLGKTHLLHAIGNYAYSLYAGIRVRYVNSEEFTNDFINSIRDDKAEAFQRRYRDIDILLVDDIQFLQGKEQTMEEFFHTFNTLHNANKQVVITSDLPPKQLAGFEDRMRSRFEWGLLTDVQPPDLETRIAILQKKAGAENLNVPNDVLAFIASRIATNIRELEGALIRVTAFANLNRQQVDLTLAEIVLKDLITDEETPEISSTTVMTQTADYFGLTIDDLCGSSRSRVLVNARQIAMYLCRELTEMSLPKIGQQFGGRDHTTVMHADRKIRQLMAERRSIYNQVTELTNRIKQQTRS